MQCLCVLILSSNDHSSLMCLTVRSQWGPLVDYLAHCSQSHWKTLLCTSCCLQGLSGIKDTKVNNFFCLSYQVEMAVFSTKKLIDVFIFDVPIVLAGAVCLVIAAQLRPAIHSNLQQHLQTVVWWPRMCRKPQTLQLHGCDVPHRHHHAGAGQPPG